MFKELYPLARTAPIAMMVSAEGEKMRIVVTQKTEGAVTAPLSLSVLATPEELDAELPGAIAAAAGELDKPAPVAEQVRSQVAASNAAAAPASKGKPKPAAAAKAKPQKAIKPKAERKPKSVKTAAPPAIPKRTPKLRASRPGGDACIADYHRLFAAHGDKLTRESFMDEAPTGRRFERVFGNWSKFVEAAQAKGTQGPPADQMTAPLPLDDPGAQTRESDPIPPAPAEPAPETAAEVHAEASSLEKDEPDIQSAAAQAPNVPQEAPPEAPRTRTVCTMTGKILAGGYTTEPQIGDEFEIEGHGKVRVRTIDEETIFVDLIPPRRRIIDDEGENLGIHEGAIAIGAEIDLPDGMFKVVRATDKAIFVERTLAAEV